MTMFNMPVEPRRLTLNAPHATPATVGLIINRYRRTPATWRCDRTERELLAPPYATWTETLLQLLVQEVASWRPADDEPLRSVVVRVELVGWKFHTSVRYPRLIVESRTWRACIPLEDRWKAKDSFTAPMLAVFEDWHARSPFVVSTPD